MVLSGVQLLLNVSGNSMSKSAAAAEDEKTTASRSVISGAEISVSLEISLGLGKAILSQIDSHTVVFQLL